MDKHTYDQFTECNYDDAWELVRDGFILHVFGKWSCSGHSLAQTPIVYEYAVSVLVVATTI